MTCQSPDLSGSHPALNHGTGTCGGQSASPGPVSALGGRLIRLAGRERQSGGVIARQGFILDSPLYAPF